MNVLRQRLVLLSFLFCFSLSAVAGSVNSIALFNLRPISMDAIGADADLLYSLEVELGKSSEISVLSRRDIEAVLHRIGGAQVSDINLVIAYGQEMGVSFILTGDVDKLGSSMKVNINLIDIIGGRVVKTWQESYTGRGDVLQRATPLAEDIKNSIFSAAEDNLSNVSSASIENEIEHFKNISAIAKDSGVFLSWTINEGVPVFYTNVYRGKSEDGLFEFVTSVEETQYQDNAQGELFYRLDLVLDNGNEVKGKQIVSAKAIGNVVDDNLLPPIILGSENLLHGIKINLVPQLNNKGVVGYNFYQRVNDQQWKKVHSIAKTNQLNYSQVLNKNFVANAGYQIYVSAYSELGESKRSDILTVTTHPALVLKAKDGKSLRKTELSWTQAKVGKGYKLYRKKVEETSWKIVFETSDIARLSTTDTQGLQDGKQYQYSITAFDEFTETTKSNNVLVQTKDLPGSPENLQLESNMVKSIKLTWQASDDKDVSGYVIYRKAGSMSSGDLLVEIAFVEGYMNSSFVDGLGANPLNDGEKYFYAIAARNLFGSTGNVSFAVSGETKPLPETVNNFQALAQQDNISITWEANSEPDIKNYSLYRKWNDETWKKIADVNGTSYQDKDLKAYADTSYKILVTDKKGLVSKFSPIEQVDSPLSITLAVVQEFMLRTVSLAWNSVKHIKGYKLYRKEANSSRWQLIQKSISPRQSAYRDFDRKNMKEGVKYEYKLSAFDEFLDMPASNTVSGTTKALAEPPSRFIAQSNQVKQVSLSWESTNDPDNEGYVIYRNNKKGKFEEIEKISKISTTRYTDEGSLFTSLEDGTNYVYKIATYNKFSVIGPLSEEVEANTKAIPKTISGLSIEEDVGGLMIFWQTSVDLDISSYQVYRSNSSSCSGVRKLATVDSSNDVYLDSTVKSGKSYCYQITAIDRDKLESKPSQQVNFTMPITEQGN
ncbi:MAG: fibronectin type 3 domain-containing protein/TolB-like protein [Colwellia sp.]|jgi:fibronectin type 3 domain-containing protein/TolB-like protein